MRIEVSVHTCIINCLYLYPNCRSKVVSIKIHCFKETALNKSFVRPAKCFFLSFFLLSKILTKSWIYLHSDNLDDATFLAGRWSCTPKNCCSKKVEQFLKLSCFIRCFILQKKVIFWHIYSFIRHKLKPLKYRGNVKGFEFYLIFSTVS